MFRREGRRIKSRLPMDTVSSFIMPNRTGASNSFSATIDVEKCEQFISRKRKEGMKSFGMIHIFMAAYVRTISQFPGINRYIRGQRLYARYGIDLCMVMKKSLTLNAPETVLKVSATPYDTIETIFYKLSDQIAENRIEGDRNAMDYVARALVSLPRVFLKFVVWLLKFFDYFGILPKVLTDLSPFHGSMFITNMGSLGMPPVIHHLYDFGNLPVFISMGSKRTEYVLDKEGNPVRRRLLNFTITCDDRICDGHYYSSAFKKLKRYLENPSELSSPPETVVEDIK